jgi:hypothetical protein
LAIQSLTNAPRSDDELCKIDEFHIFTAERAVILKNLEQLRSVDWIVDEAEELELEPDLISYIIHSVGRLMFFRCCEEPTRFNRLKPVQAVQTVD